MGQFTNQNTIAAMLNPQVANLGLLVGAPIAQGMARADNRNRQDQLMADKLGREQQAMQSKANAQKEAAFASSLLGVTDEQLPAFIQQGVQSGQFNDDFIQELSQISAIPSAQRDKFITSTLVSEGFKDLVPGFGGGNKSAIKGFEGEFTFKDENENIFSQQTVLDPNTGKAVGMLTDVTGRGASPTGKLTPINKSGMSAMESAALDTKSAEDKKLAESSTKVAEQEADAERIKAQAKDQQAASKAAFNKAQALTGQLAKIDKAINALDKGAKSGRIESMLPTFTKATTQLEEAAKELGIEVINSATFGALSAPELKLALDTALPLNLDEDDLREYLFSKKQAMQKLQNEIVKMGRFLSKKGNSMDKWMANQQGDKVSTAPPQSSGRFQIKVKN